MFYISSVKQSKKAFKIVKFPHFSGRGMYNGNSGLKC